jgi:glycosyltransferase involved in cell wall biosynthesis
VDRPEADGARFKEKHGLRRPYLTYVGRQEPGKGVKDLLRYHRVLRQRYADAPDLVLAGDTNMDLSGEGVRYLGRIGEQDKYDALAGALAVVVPSRYESLSLLTLEAFAQGTPVLVNGRSDVLTGQVERSGAGRTFTDLDSFITGLREVGEQRAALGKKGLAYVKKQGWPQVVAAYREELERILEEKRQ